MTEETQVIMALARKFYLAFCQHKGWTPTAYPYVDEGSLRNAQIAVTTLGYDSSDLAWVGEVAA